MVRMNACPLKVGKSTLKVGKSTHTIAPVAHVIDFMVSGAPLFAVAVARPWNPSNFRGTTEPSPTPKPEVRFI